MDIVAITALGVGGATVIGAIIGFLFGDLSGKYADGALSFAAGVMLSAAYSGLILPSLDSGGIAAIPITVIGILSGAVAIRLIDLVLKRILPGKTLGGANGDGKNRLLFVLAIAIHNLPEGIAAGVAFGTDNARTALACAIGIALQNIPEGMVIISPMVGAGVSRARAFFYALMTGVVEVVGTFIGYFAVNIAMAALPFALSFAAGTMLFVIVDEMVPETHSGGNGHVSTGSFIVGFCFMLMFSELISGI